MIPRFAARSSAATRARWSSGLPLAACRFARERKRLMTLRLRRVRRGVWRARLAADLELAIGSSFLWAVRVGETSELVKTQSRAPAYSRSPAARSALNGKPVRRGVMLDFPVDNGIHA